MLLRLIPGFGGDGTVHGIIVLNDTGSDILTLDTTDLQQLGNIQGYLGWYAPTIVIDANGTGSSRVAPRSEVAPRTPIMLPGTADHLPGSPK